MPKSSERRSARTVGASATHARLLWWRSRQALPVSNGLVVSQSPDDATERTVAGRDDPITAAAAAVRQRCSERFFLQKPLQKCDRGIGDLLREARNSCLGKVVTFSDTVRFPCSRRNDSLQNSLEVRILTPTTLHLNNLKVRERITKQYLKDSEDLHGLIGHLTMNTGMKFGFDAGHCVVQKRQEVVT